MTRDAASRFPELARVFSAYLHEDFVDDYGSPDAALRAFRDETSPVEWRRFQREARRLAALVERRDFGETRTLLARLGSRWTPPSPEAVLALLAGVTAPSRSNPR